MRCRRELSCPYGANKLDPGVDTKIFSGNPPLSSAMGNNADNAAKFIVNKKEKFVAGIITGVF